MMEKVKSSESNRDSRSHDLRRVFFAVFTGILFLGVFAPEKTLGDGGEDPDTKVVWMVKDT